MKPAETVFKKLPLVAILCFWNGPKSIPRRPLANRAMYKFDNIGNCFNPNELTLLLWETASVRSYRFIAKVASLSITKVAIPYFNAD